jgi:23S rRNA (uracil1939-C5)-methyltransferase
MPQPRKRKAKRSRNAGRVDRETPITLQIDSLGARGDGLADHDGRTVYVAGALPGEKIVARLVGHVGDALTAEIIDLDTPSPDRRAPPCPHYAACGGCVAQHIETEAYQTWKRRRVIEALHSRGFRDPPVDPLVNTPAGTRRRATMAAHIGPDIARIGFRERRGHAITEIPNCQILVPEIIDLARKLAADLPTTVEARGALGVRVQATETGLDVTLLAHRAPSLAEREKLAALAESTDLARLTWDDDGTSEMIALRRPPMVRFGSISVDPPAGAFLQASADGEAAIVTAVMNGLGETKRVADLFAGCGSLTFPIASTAAVHAVDSDPEMIAALTAAANRATLSCVTSETRDLFARPLEPTELTKFDAVVFDPPRAGARAQVSRLATSDVPTVIAVSCEPSTFARDARMLVDGGYALESVTPIDQFLWTSAVELVAVFRRARTRPPSRPRRR